VTHVAGIRKEAMKRSFEGKTGSLKDIKKHALKEKRFGCS
jgi:hypothetical protein